MAATTRATSPTRPAGTQPATTTPAGGGTEPDAAGPEEPLAKVIPLGIFDPFAEAQKRW